MVTLTFRKAIHPLCITIKHGMIFILFHLFLLNLTAQTPQIWPIEISFNYEPNNYANDALNIRKNGTTTISVPEYVQGVRNESFAYIMGQNNIKVRVKFGSNVSNMNFLVKATVISGTGIGNICETFVSSCDINTNAVTLVITNAMPAVVGKWTFTWKWEATALPTSTPYCPTTCPTINTQHTFYTLLAEPKAPMQVPWAEVLDYACSWANGQSISSETMQKIVEGLYNNTGFLYDIYYGAPRYTSYSTQSFNLTSMLSEIGGSQVVVNCYDMGKAVNIFANALGCNSVYAFTNPFGYLNCIKPIGRSWTNNPFYVYRGTNPIMGEDDDYFDGRTDFGNHAFCMFGNIIYDACLKVDTDNNPDAPPHIESWATGWNWNIYKSKVIDNYPVSYPGTPYTGYTFSVY